MSEREYCPACQRQRRALDASGHAEGCEISALEDENTRLRERLAQAEREIAPLHEEMAAVGLNWTAATGTLEYADAHDLVRHHRNGLLAANGAWKRSAQLWKARAETAEAKLAQACICLVEDSLGPAEDVAWCPVHHGRAALVRHLVELGVARRQAEREREEAWTAAKWSGELAETAESRERELVAALEYLRQGEDIDVRLGDWQPHSSHQMAKWRLTILNFGGSDRFGSIRECSECGGNEAKGGQSHRADTVLTVECGYDPYALLARLKAPD